MKKLCLALITFLTCCLSASAQSGLFIAPSSSPITSPVAGQSWLFNSSNYTVGVWNGSAYRIVNTPFSNYTASTNPTSSNDNTQGYVIGSLWVNQVTQGIFMATNVSTSAAVWTGINAVVTTIPLNDLQQGGATDGQSLVWNNTAGVWNPASPLIGLSQLTQSGATDGQGITWNGSAWVASNVGAGTVTTFSSGNLSPLFTSSVANATSTPALTFSLSNAASKSFLGVAGGSSAAPAFFVPTITAGTGLSGGGNIADSPTLSLTTPVTVANGGTGAATVSANTWFGNHTGSTAAPGFETIGTPDLPSNVVAAVTNSAAVLSASVSAQNLALSYSGTALPVANGGTGATTGTGAFNNLITGTATSGQVAEYNGTNWVPATVTGTGTVTSMSSGNLSPLFTTSVATSTTTPALSFSLSTQTANTLLSGPASGSAATPTFRFMVANDEPATTVNSVSNLSPLFTSSVSAQALTFTQSNAAGNSVFCNNTGTPAVAGFNVLTLTTGNGLTGGGNLTSNVTVGISAPVSIANGGSGLTSTPTDGQLLIGNSNTNSYDLATLTAGAGLSVTNGHGTSTVSLQTPVTVAHGGTGTSLLTSGTATFLSGASVAVADSTITSSSIVMVTQGGNGSALVETYDVELSPGTGFTIYSSNVASTAIVNYLRIK